MIRSIAAWLLASQLIASGIGFGPTCPAVHAVAGFMPTQVRYCQLWVDANRLCMPAGSLVDNWEDFSLRGNDPIANSGSGRPVVSNVNGRPCIKFDGVNDYLTVGSLVLMTDICLYVVLKDGTADKLFFIEHSANSQLNDGFALSGDLVPWRVRRSADRGANGTSGWAGADWAVISFTYNAATTNGVHSRNAVAQSISSYTSGYAPANTGVDAPFFLQARGGTDFFSDSSIAEIVIVTNSILPSVEQSMIRYLGTKYGIVVP